MALYHPYGLPCFLERIAIGPVIVQGAQPFFGLSKHAGFEQITLHQLQLLLHKREEQITMSNRHRHFQNPDARAIKCAGAPHQKRLSAVNTEKPPPG
jgi:hypothetical protein